MTRLANIALFATLLLAQTKVFADSSLTLSDRISGLPFLKDAKVEINPGPAFAAVQPTAHLTFKFSSCAAYDFVVEKEESQIKLSRTTLIGITVSPYQRDCFGPEVERDYRVQISSDTFADGDFVLVNPTAVTVKTVEQPPMFCTAIAGVVINEETGECVSFTNGCMLSSLQAQGYRFASSDECSL
ncbi:MAG: hypothetical protein HRU19_11245 [Pseudobacteriovorax sp.]|nr:hypothetical protein [Pseudobacteriovorax sp.]